MVTTFKVVDFHKNIHNHSLTDSLGFHVAGGYLTDIPATIFDVDRELLSDKLCKIEEGDILVEINGINTRNLTIHEVLKQLRLSGNHVLLKLKSDPIYKFKFKDLKKIKPSLDDLQTHVSTNTSSASCGSPTKTPHHTYSPKITSKSSLISKKLNSKSLDDNLNDTASDIEQSISSPSLDSSPSASPESYKYDTETTHTHTSSGSTSFAFNIEIDDTIRKKIDEKLKNCTCESDSESVVYTPKAVDLPSAQRLAKRLFYLDGFKASDVVRHLAKKNDFSQLVAEEYLKLFNFQGLTLDSALRKFLKQFQLLGDAQEKERVLMYFAKHYVDSNETAFSDVDTCHTLTCAIMLLNTDLHDSKIQNKMSLNEFIENLKGLNDGVNFADILLETLYNAIKLEPLECASLEVEDIPYEERLPNGFTSNPFLSLPDPQFAKEYKSGWLLRKCCIESDGKRSAFLKRSWKMFYASIRDMVLYMHKDDKDLKKNLFGNITNVIRIHHAYACVANDYKKKQFVFRLKTADSAEYLFQTSNTNELNEWISLINLVAAMFSSPALAQPVCSAKTFQRPLLPVSTTHYSLSEQCECHRKTLKQLKSDYEQLELSKDDKTFDKDKHNFLTFEIQRYTTYLELLEEKLSVDLVPKALANGINHVAPTIALFNESIVNTNLNHNNHEIKNLLNGNKKLINNNFID